MSDLDRMLGDAVADGKIDTEDAEVVQEFAAFLADPEVGKPGEPLSLSMLRRYQDLLGLTDEQIAQAEKARHA